MNRIYQGRVTRVQKLKPGTKGKRPDDWEEFNPDPQLARSQWETALWQHHELFQDAVNYYTLALAAMAEGAGDESFRADWVALVVERVQAGAKPKERDKLVAEAKSSAAAQLDALQAWRAQVRDNWLDGRRKAIRYDGPHRRLAPLLGVDANLADEHAAFDACARAILNDNGSTPAQRAAALLQLLEEANKSDLNQLCVARLPFLCTEKGKFGATSKAVSSRQEVERQRLARKFRALPDSDALAQAPQLDLGLFLTQPPTEQVTGDDAVKMLRAYWGKAAKKFPALAPLEERFSASLAAAKDTLAVPSPGRKPSGLYPIAAVFRSFPCAETLAAFHEATRSLCEAKDKTAASDALAEVRVGDEPVFDYFTNRAFHRDPAEQNRAVWFEFDLAAFIEAIKAPHRYFQDTQKRQQDAEKLRARIAAMEQQGAPDTDEDGDSGASFGFADDQRIALLRELVTDPVNGLAYLAEAEGTALGTAEYTIQERTLRGWSAIRDQWRALAEKGEAIPEKLWSIVATEQAAHRDDFGSATLYKKLAEPRYHPIWRDKGTRPWHADDPLRAWLQYTELRFDLADKTRPIRFTPAHAIHSPRYFIFPKKSAAGGRWGSEHETGALAFTAGIAVRDGEKWRPQMLRITYAAPRLRRDELRRPDEQSLDTAPWLQPMMKALGLPEPPQQDFGNCRITLQPSAPDNVQLTFPVEVDPAKLIAHLGKQNLWSRQFNVTPDGDEFRDATLRWPHEKKPSKPPIPWHEALDSFRCLSVDLGQREAGAFALLEARANHDFSARPSRFIGETPGKQWRAVLAASGLLRLSGEDREEWRAKTSKDTDDSEAFAFREELHGSRGRMPRLFETQECRELLDAFLGPSDPKTFLPPGWDDPQSPARLSFPEQNDKLLVAARRAQSRLARLHRWCWFLRDDKKRLLALTEIRESLSAIGAEQGHWLPAELKEFVQTDNDPRLFDALKNLLEARQQELPALLVRLANRILPLRGRSWKWERHPDATEQNQIHLLTQNGPPRDTPDRPVWLRGQRGLSIERIEQIEELRRRFQSLNQTLRREIGGKPPIRRDESVPDPCPDLLEKLDNLKEQRVNQTAHLILAEALGVRLAKPPANKAALKAERDQHGVYEKVREPVDFIVIEDLSRYRASQGRAPRENSRLMKWCHRQVRDKLRELCEPFGIPVLETPAAYSSRFCSRTGVAGFRAVEVTAGFENEPPWCWLKDKQSDGQLTEEAQCIRRTAEELRQAQAALDAEWAAKYPGQKAPRRTLLLPQAGGPIFVPVTDEVGNTNLKPAITQADLNAAINLGLRAIADPRLWTIHPRLRTERVGGEVKKPRGKKQSDAPSKADVTVRLKAREKRKYGESAPELALGTLPKSSAVEDTRNPNYFFDVAGIAAWDTATVPDPVSQAAVPLVSGKALWGAVRQFQWQRCRTINEQRLAAWQDKLDPMPD